MLAVFDLDGTLVDSAHDLAASASELVTGLGGRPLSTADVIDMVGEGAALLVSRALTAAGLDPATPDALATFKAIYDRRLLERTCVYDGIPDALRDVAAAGPMAVLTNKPLAPARRILEALGLQAFFVEVLGGDGPLPRKPDPSGLHALRAHAPDGALLLVGDTPIDASTAAAAGVPFVLAQYGFGATRFDPARPGTRYVAAHARELPALIARARHEHASR